MAAPKEQDSLQALEQLEDALAKDPPPVLLLCGKERFLVNRAVDAVKAAVLDPRTRDFNFDLLEGKDATPARILSVARTLPMMARRRLVLVRDLDDLSAARTTGLVSTIGLVAGGALLATGAIVFFTAPSSTSKSKPAASASLGFAMGPSGGFVSIAGSLQ